MSRLPGAICAMHIMALLACSMSANAAAPPSPADLARCAAIAAPEARLACYDALTGTPGRATSSAPAPLTPATPATPAAPAGAVTGVASAPASAAGTTPTAAASPASPPAGSGAAQEFGLSQTQLHPLPVGPSSMEARIAKIVNTMYGRNSVVLDNGQTWTYTDSDQDTRLSPGDSVTIQRASIGSFLMKTPSRHAYHVRRTQ